MKREIQERVWRETQGMTREQEIEHTREAARRFRDGLSRDPSAGKGNFKALFEALEIEQGRRGNL